MYEIELKARVYNRNELIERLHASARYLGKTEKTDRYWRQNGVQKPVTVRIRGEYTEKEKSPHWSVTCKRKGLHTDVRNPAVEVNSEQEFGVSDGEAFEEFIRKAGFSLISGKHKHVLQWKHEDVLIELCTVEPLGDFLELEILTEEINKEKTKKCRIKLEKLLETYGIPLEQIEPMYYSELLETHGKKKTVE